MVVETRAAALALVRSGSNDLLWAIRNGLIGEEPIYAEIGELISGAQPGRISPEQITLYKSVAVAVEEAVAARDEIQIHHDARPRTLAVRTGFAHRRTASYSFRTAEG